MKKNIYDERITISMVNKTKLNSDLISTMARLFELGCTAKATYDAVRVGASTYVHWIKVGEESKEKDPENLSPWELLCVELVEETNQAQAKFQEKNLTIIEKAAPKTWTAAAWLLERRNPKDFSIYSRADIRKDERVKITFEDVKPAEEKKDKRLKGQGGERKRSAKQNREQQKALKKIEEELNEEKMK